MDRLRIWLIMVIVFTMVTISCGSVREAAYGGLTAAVSDRVEREVEREVSSMLEGYTSAMLYQLAYSQAFLVGGFGVGLEDFAEGEGATWRIESGDNSETHSYTTERALLKKNDDGSSWWYLRYQPEDDEAIEYEIKMTQHLDPMEMYFRDPNTGEVEHHVFEVYGRDEQFDEGEEQLEEEGFRTAHYFVEDWEEYPEREESVRVGTRNFNATVLFYRGTEEDGDEDTEVRWWVAEDVPGQLLKYEMTDRSEGGRAFGEMTDLRSGYTVKFANI